MQFVKGGFSFLAKKEAAFRDEVRQAGITSNAFKMPMIVHIIATTFGRIRFVRDWYRLRVNIDGHRRIRERMSIRRRRG